MKNDCQVHERNGITNVMLSRFEAGRFLVTMPCPNKIVIPLYREFELKKFLSVETGSAIEESAMLISFNLSPRSLKKYAKRSRNMFEGFGSKPFNLTFNTTPPGDNESDVAPTWFPRSPKFDFKTPQLDYHSPSI